jgi:ABC-2 type transport system ATP-binding protein
MGWGNGRRDGEGISLQEVTVRLGSREVLRSVTLRVKQGVVAVVGPNGSGKTTLLRTLAGLVRTSSGEIRLAGCDMRSPAGIARARPALGFLPQDPAYHEHLRVREAILYAAWLHRIGRFERERAVDRALGELDLWEVADRRLRHLSGGTRRRVYIAQALVHQPHVLLLDEPTVGLDPEHRVELRRLIRRLADGRLVLLTTHLTEDVELLPDRVVALVDGSVRFDGTPGELLAIAGEMGGGGDERPIERALRLVSERPVR